VGFIFEITADGYGGVGSLKLMVAVSEDGVIIATKTLANGETKGLGSRVSEPAFESQFNGKTNLDDFQAITGATISSTAYRGAVEQALALYNAYCGSEDMRQPAPENEIIATEVS
jgi:electron transport complex protein RnfG